MDRILVSGVSGPIGTAFLASFAAQGTRIVRLVRGRPQNAAQVSWDPLAQLSPAAVSGFDAVVHLAGESVVGRWTNEKKSAIRDSRVLGTRNLAAALAQCEAKPRVLVCASAVGFYGDRGDEVLGEEESGWAGISARGLPRVGGRQPDCGRGRYPHGEHTDWDGAEREGRGARKNADAVQAGAGRPDWIGAAVVELDSCGRHRGGNSSRDAHGVALWAGEFCGAESGAKRASLQKCWRRCWDALRFFRCRSLRCGWLSASKPRRKCCLRARGLSRENSWPVGISSAFASCGRRWRIWWDSPLVR